MSARYAATKLNKAARDCIATLENYGLTVESFTSVPGGSLVYHTVRNQYAGVLLSEGWTRDLRNFTAGFVAGCTRPKPNA